MAGGLHASPAAPHTQAAVSRPARRHALHRQLAEPLVVCPVGKGSEIGDFLTCHPAVNCISFTGGDTGLSISKKVSRQGQPGASKQHYV